MLIAIIDVLGMAACAVHLRRAGKRGIALTAAERLQMEAPEIKHALAIILVIMWPAYLLGCLVAAWQRRQESLL